MAKAYDNLENEAMRYGAGVPVGTKFRTLSDGQRQGFDDYMKRKIRNNPSAYADDVRAHKYLRDYDQGTFDAMRQQEIRDSVDPGGIWDDFGGSQPINSWNEAEPEEEREDQWRRDEEPEEAPEENDGESSEKPNETPSETPAPEGPQPAPGLGGSGPAAEGAGAAADAAAGGAEALAGAAEAGSAVAGAAAGAEAGAAAAGAAAAGEGLVALQTTPVGWVLDIIIILGIIILLVAGFTALDAAFPSSASGLENSSSAASSTPAVAGTVAVSYLNQFTTDTTSCPVVGKTAWDFGTKTGCGITSQAMVESFFLKRKVTPDDIYYGRNGHPAQGLYFNYSILNRMIESTGVKYVRIANISNVNEAETALKKAEEGVKNGYPSISHTYPPFAHSYHIMVVIGFDNKGNIYINDPNCGPTAAKAYLTQTPGTGKARLADREKFKQAMVGRPFEYPIKK